MVMDISFYIKVVSEHVLGWPLMIYVVGGKYCFFTIAFRAIQFRYFATAWKTILFPSERTPTKAVGDMTPIQAFINTLSASLGNGSIAGMATAIYAGGPGAAFWVVIFGLLLMAVRFAEVYTSTLYGSSVTNRSTLGGPMLYLKYVIGGDLLAYCYAVFCLLFGLITGNAMQANSIRLSVATTWGVPPLVSAIILLIFVLYVVCGSQEIIPAG